MSSPTAQSGPIGLGLERSAPTRSHLAGVLAGIVADHVGAQDEEDTITDEPAAELFRDEPWRG